MPKAPRDIGRSKTSGGHLGSPFVVLSKPMAKDLKFTAVEQARLQQMEELLTKHGLVRDRHGLWTDPKEGSIARMAKNAKQSETTDAV